MVETAVFEAGNYRYVRGPFQYSGGVAAQPGYAIERVRFASRPNMVEGFKAIEAHLTARGRPFTAWPSLIACARCLAASFSRKTSFTSCFCTCRTAALAMVSFAR